MKKAIKLIRYYELLDRKRAEYEDHNEERMRVDHQAVGRVQGHGLRDVHVRNSENQPDQRIQEGYESSSGIERSLSQDFSSGLSSDLVCSTAANKGTVLQSSAVNEVCQGGNVRSMESFPGQGSNRGKSIRSELGGLVEDPRQLGESVLTKADNCNRNRQEVGTEHPGGSGTEANMDRFRLLSRSSSILGNNNDERWVDLCAGQQWEPYE